MKNFKVFVVVVATVLGYSISYGQQVAGFDDLNLNTNSYWIGANQGSNDFESEFAHFSHQYDTTYYSWNGFAYSNVFDTITAGWMNQYASRPGSGVEETANYGVFYQWGNDSIWFDTSMVVSGLYVSNSTLTALSIQEGDDFAKKFGGESGNDPDWFLLTIKGFDANNNETGMIEFYLADYRFENNAQDYIVTDWQWIDLISLNEVKTLKFSLSSSDNGDWGMNTPAYFCLDEIKIDDQSKINVLGNSNIALSVFPNPFVNTISIKTMEKVKIHVYNINGQIVYKQNLENSYETIDLSGLEKGIYFLTIYSPDGVETRKIVKK